LGGTTSNCGDVLVVDADAESRLLLHDVFERAGFIVREASDSHEALRLVEEQNPDAVILEVATRGMTGYGLCRLLRVRFGEQLPIVFVSGDRVESLDRTAGLLLGADDYVVKPFDPEELLARVQRLLVRSNKNHAIRPTALEGDRRTHSGLTPRESEILELLVEGLNQAQIAQRLVISPNTVATHIQRILVKLGVHNRAQAVASAVRDGLVPLGTQATLESALDVSQRRADTARPESPASAPRRRMTSVD
jgi:DNA-binding NarL/FixJ family response regulator